MMTARKYPIGIQTFSRIICEGCVYIDKTDLVWQLAHYGTFIFLSRPRRFGKSLLTSTLESYFRGERELFEGLKIMQLENDWEQYPVLRFDLSGAKHMNPQGARDELSRQLSKMEAVYGTNPYETTPGMRLAGLIDRAYAQTGKQVAVLIDEYDAPMLDVLHEDNLLAEMREVMQEFYQRLKMQEPYIKFCFITGITKFSQLSIFSTLNNMLNVTLLPKFASICGITEKELSTVLLEDIRELAVVYQNSEEKMHAMLKEKYDGYHFSEKSEGIYNPYSLLTAFSNQKLGNYWFDTGTPTYLIRQLRHFNTDITDMDRLEVPESAFDRTTESMTNALPLLYQSGYLTIKDYDEESWMYMLSIPNQEVRVGYTEGLLPAFVGIDSEDVQVGFAAKFWRALKKGDVEQAMQEMKSYMAGIPYIEGFKKKLADAATSEGFYEYTMYLIFSMLNVYARTQVKCAKGRADMVVWMPDTVYVFELKANGTAREALEQIDAKGYAIPYETDNRRVVKVGVKFDQETHVPEDWVITG